MLYIGIMKTYKTPHPSLTVTFTEEEFECTDAAFVYHLNGQEVGQVQLCGSSDGYRHGYGVTIPIPDKLHWYYTNYELKTKAAAEADLVEKLIEYGIL